jgi:hypothetical protein
VLGGDEPRRAETSEARTLLAPEGKFNAKRKVRTARFRLAASDADAFTVEVGSDRARPIKFRFNKLNSA